MREAKWPLDDLEPIWRPQQHIAWCACQTAQSPSPLSTPRIYCICCCDSYHVAPILATMSTTILPLGSYSDSYHHGYCDCMANMAITNVHDIIVHRELSFLCWLCELACHTCCGIQCSCVIIWLVHSAARVPVLKLQVAINMVIIFYYVGGGVIGISSGHHRYWCWWHCGLTDAHMHIECHRASN